MSASDLRPPTSDRHGTVRVLMEVLKERARQHEEHGPDWLTAQAEAFDGDRQEVLEMAATAVALVEALDARKARAVSIAGLEEES